MLTTTCATCGKTFEHKPRSQRKHCSDFCRKKAWRRTKKAPVWAEPAPKLKGHGYKSGQWIMRLRYQIRQAGSLEEFLRTRVNLNSEERDALTTLAKHANAHDYELIHRHLALARIALYRA